MVSCFVWKFLRCSPQGEPGNRISRVFYGCLLLLILGWSGASAGAEPKFEVALDRNPITLGESAVLTISFEDGSPDEMPALPPIANLQYGGESSQESFSLIGASMTRKKTYSRELRPAKVGDYAIPALEATVSGRHLSSRPIILKVLKNAPPPAGENDVAFVKIVPATNVVYLGQILPVEVRCYCQDRVLNIQLPQFTSDNFIVGELPNTRQQASRVQVGNSAYNLFTFHTSATAIKAGKYELGPATWSMTIVGGQRDIFGRWTESKQETFTSDTPEVEVSPIPTRGAPPGFSGAVGNFALSQCDAGPTTVGVGDPITLKVRITGRGSFDTVTLPTNNEAEWREFKIYPPTSKVETTDPMQTEGSKYFEQVITPQNAEVKEIPPFALSFFDPSQGQFHTLSHPAIPLTVHATAATPQPTVISTAAPNPEGQEQGQDIVHIKPLPGTFQQVRPPLLEQPGFLVLQGILPLVWFCALGRRKYKECLANNPRLRRQKQVAETVRQGLAELDRPAAAQDAEKFYATVLRLLQEQLGERLDLPAPAITEAVVDHLSSAGLRPETPALLHELFHACNQYRYAPEHAAREMASMTPKVKMVLRDLQSMPAVSAGTTFAQGVGLALFFLSMMPLHAAPGADSFTQANKFYEEGKFSDAVGAYEKIAHGGFVSPALEFNLGNALLKSGHVGRAILAYRQAEALAPRDSDIRANLQIARAQAGANNAAFPGSRWTRWAGHLTLNEWTVAASLAVALFFLVLTAREVWPPIKRSTAPLLGVLGFGVVGFGICLGVAADQRLVEQSGVVIVAEAVARRGPLPESQSLFTVRDGAELLIAGRDGDWLQVSDAAHRIGWISQKEVAMVP